MRKKKIPVGALARKHLTQKEHTKFLAMPNFRVLRELRRKKRQRKRPVYYTSVRRAALRAVTSSRTEMLAIPHIPPNIIALNKKLKEKALLTMAEKCTLEKVPDHYVPIATRKVSPRMIRLAVPRQNILEDNYEKATVYGPKYKKRIELEYKKYSQYYKKTRIFFHKRSHKGFGDIFMYKLVPKKSVRRLKNKKQLEKYRAWLKKIAKPKPKYKPAPMPKRKKRPLSFLQARIDEISTPKYYYEKPISLDEIFKVKRSALSYKTSQRMRELCVPKKIPVDEGPVLTESGVNPAALKAIASPRINIIAAPIERKQKAESEFKENPFAVSPNALKAKCSKRLTELSRHVDR